MNGDAEPAFLFEHVPAGSDACSGYGFAECRINEQHLDQMLRQTLRC